jgi:hypothetical protein
MNALRRWLYRGTLSCAMCFIITLTLYNRTNHVNVKYHKSPVPIFCFLLLLYCVLNSPSSVCMYISSFYFKQNFVVFEINLIRQAPSYKQLEVKMNQPSFEFGNHNTEPKTSRHIIGEHKTLKRCTH